MLAKCHCPLTQSFYTIHTHTCIILFIYTVLFFFHFLSFLSTSLPLSHCSSTTTTFLVLLSRWRPSILLSLLTGFLHHRPHPRPRLCKVGSSKIVAAKQKYLMCFWGVRPRLKMKKQVVKAAKVVSTMAI
jgi:hypothetical protein